MDPMMIIAIAAIIFVVYVTWPLWVMLFIFLCGIVVVIGGVCLIVLAWVLEKIGIAKMMRQRHFNKLVKKSRQKLK